MNAGKTETPASNSEATAEANAEREKRDRLFREAVAAISEHLAGREHSDSGELQAEDRGR